MPLVSLNDSLKLTTSLDASLLSPALLQAGDLWTIDPSSQGGVILQKTFYADFVSPGAAIGGHFDASCTAVYVIGQVKLQHPSSHRERQQAIQQRMTCADQLALLTRAPSPLRRGYLIISHLCRSLGMDAAQAIPTEVISQLAGIFPKTVHTVWNQLAGENFLEDICQFQS